MRALFRDFNFWAALTALVAVLAGAAFVRFVNITQTGLYGHDTVQYWEIGRAWSQGHFIFNAEGFRYVGFEMDLFRPVAFALHGLAFRLIGATDYTLKVLHGAMDLATITTIFAIGYRVCKSWVPALAAAALYAGSPFIIEQARLELVHIPSATFVAASFLSYVFYGEAKTKDKTNALKFAALTGFFLSDAALIHPDLALLGPAYVALIFWHNLASHGDWRSRVTHTIIEAAALSAAFFTLHLLFLAVLGPSRVIDMIMTVRGIEIIAESYPPLGLTWAFLTDGIGQIGSPWVSHAFLASFVIAAAHFFRQPRSSLISYAPFILIISYCLSFELLIPRTNTHALFRLLIPLLPLVCTAIATWFFILGRKAFGQWNLLIYTPAAAAIVIWTFLPHIPSLQSSLNGTQTIYRAVYDNVGHLVNSDNRLLITPYLAWYRPRTLRNEVYFGDNALYLIDETECRRADYTAEDLLRDQKIGFIFVMTGKGLIDFKLLAQETFLHNDASEPDPWFQAPVALGSCWGIDPKDYDPEQEKEAIQTLLARHNAREVYEFPGYARVYELGN